MRKKTETVSEWEDRILRTQGTGISWAHFVENRWIGCQRVSPACRNCYAEAGNVRWHGGDNWGADSPRRIVSDARWNRALSWNALAAATGHRYRVFCSSQSDIFEDRRDLDPYRLEVFEMIARTPNLDWLLLTKRADRIAALIRPWIAQGGKWPMPNVWLGTTAEDQRRADERIPALLSVPAAVHWISAEPLLEKIDVSRYLKADRRCPTCNGVGHLGAIGGCGRCQGSGEFGGAGVSWVVIGGESGSEARPMMERWVHDLLGQCRTARARPFFKQWGRWAPADLVAEMLPEWQGRFQEFGNVLMASAGMKLGNVLAGGETIEEFPISPAAARWHHDRHYVTNEEGIDGL